MSDKKRKQKEQEYQKAMEDAAWWQDRLPSGWTLHGWTYRTSASAWNPSRTRVVQLDGEFFQDAFLKG